MEFIFDNIIFSKEKQGGISNYWYELIKQYQQNEDAFFYEEKNALENIFRKQLVLQNLIPHTQLPLIFSRILPVNYKSDKDYLLYHSSYYRKLNTNAKFCEFVTVHDFTHDYFSSKLKKNVHNSLKYSAIERSQGIVCISNNTYSDLKKFCKIKSTQKVKVIYNGVNEDYFKLLIDMRFRLPERLQSGKKYLLFVGSRAGYKNFEIVVEMLKELLEYDLVVIGNDFTDQEKIKVKEVTQRITLLKNIPNDLLNVLYNYAHALIYPSSYEGFGIPILEAMKAGCPVVAFNSSSIPEVAGEAGLLVNQLSRNDFNVKVKDLEDINIRNQFIEAGIKNAKRFSWAKCMEELQDFYKEVYHSQNQLK